LTLLDLRILADIEEVAFLPLSRAFDENQLSA